MGLIEYLFRKLRAREGHSASFTLRYAPPDGDPLDVGILRREDDAWLFRYTEEYRSRRDELRPLEGFDDLDREYRSKDLFPFFAVRIPPADRPDVKRVLEKRQVDNPDIVDLLRIFGRRAGSSPAFELRAS
jgi:HipA-like protein